MPIKGRARLVATKASGTKLFTDDLREVVKLSQVERKTVSDVIRELVHEALVTRRQRAMGRDEEENYLRRIHQQAITASVSPLERELKAVKEMMTEILGFTMVSEMKTHLFLQNFLMSRGLNEESAQRLIAEHEAKSRQNTEKIVVQLSQS